MFNSKTLDPSKVTFGKYKSPGVKFVDRKVVPIEKIYIPAIKDNPVRKNKKDPLHVARLQTSLSSGIDYSKSPPLVKRSVKQIDGDIFEYELIAGNHRLEAMRISDIEEWIFDEYEIFGNDKVTYNDALRTLQLLENNHSPQLPSSESDVVSIVCKMIEEESKLVEPNEQSIREYVDAYCSNMHHMTRSKAVRDIVKWCEASLGITGTRDVVTFSPLDIRDYVEKKTDLKTHGDYDPIRKAHGWTVMESYEREFIFNAAKKYLETNRPSYFLCHTKEPTASVSLKARREKMIKDFKKLEDSLLESFEYYEKHGKFPWSIIAFAPQDTRIDDGDIVPVEKILKDMK